MSRPPPVDSRREAFVDLALQYAEDNSYGYSQKPPSGRWGPDYDCSSLLYFLANKAGYPVGSGSDKVRFTGTMLKDFEKAGFQILPFANVGISDLEVGDILLNLAQQYRYDDLMRDYNKLDQRLNTQELRSDIAAATANVVRYPNGFVYNAGPSPFCGCNNWNNCCSMAMAA